MQDICLISVFATSAAKSNMKRKLDMKTIVCPTSRLVTWIISKRCSNSIFSHQKYSSTQVRRAHFFELQLKYMKPECLTVWRTSRIRHVRLIEIRAVAFGKRDDTTWCPPPRTPTQTSHHSHPLSRKFKGSNVIMEGRQFRKLCLILFFIPCFVVCVLLMLSGAFSRDPTQASWLLLYRSCMQHSWAKDNET